MDAIELVKLAIKRKIGSAAAKMMGYDNDLTNILAGVEEIERRLGVLAEAYLLMYERAGSDVRRVTLHPNVIESLGNMNAHAKMIARRLLHGPLCKCSDCTPMAVINVATNEGTTGGTVCKPKG